MLWKSPIRPNERNHDFARAEKFYLNELMIAAVVEPVGLKAN